MNCQDVEKWIPDWARSGEDAREPGPEALAHLRECARCGEAFEEQRRLTEGLAALAMSSREEQAPARVEESVRAAFRQRYTSAPPVPRIRKAWILAPVAGLAAAAVLFLFREAPAPQMASGVTVAPNKPAPVLNEQPTAAMPLAIAASRAIKTPRKRTVRSRPVPAESSVTDNRTAFLPVLQGDGWTPLDGAKVMRVELPESAFGVLGLPAPAGNGLEQVQADVMLSDDGLVRGVRFVSFRQ